MSVTLKWIEPEELSDYLQKGWTEVQLHFRGGGKFLIASPEEPASEPAKVECENCRQTVDYADQHYHREDMPHVAAYFVCDKPAKVECPNCGRLGLNSYTHWEKDQPIGCPPLYTCKRPQPAQPEPVDFCPAVPNQRCDYNLAGQCIYCREFKPEPVAEDAELDRAFDRGYEKGVIDQIARQPAPAKVVYSQADRDMLLAHIKELESQPANVRMTPELERMVYFFENMGSESAKKDAAAVRAQAAEAGKVRMPKVRELLDHLDTEIGFSSKIDVLTQAAFEEVMSYEKMNQIFDDRNDEAKRRLARYDEAIRLLRLAKFDEDTWHEADAFLAAEPKEGR